MMRTVTEFESRSRFFFGTFDDSGTGNDRRGSISDSSFTGREVGWELGAGNAIFS
jgi:hypothetical protein